MNFIADFMCKELSLIIEVDGITHDNKLEKDKSRDEKLRQAGFDILRFTDEEVLTNIEGVSREIEKYIKRTSPLPPPKGDSLPPAPSEGGQEDASSGGVE